MPGPPLIIKLASRETCSLVESREGQSRICSANVTAINLDQAAVVAGDNQPCAGNCIIITRVVKLNRK